MNKSTLKALKGSIEKWEKIVAGTGLDRGAHNCNLCRRFFKLCSINCCIGCPVNTQSGSGCMGTPFDEWMKYEGLLPHNDRGGYDFKGNVKAKNTAHRELKFLKSLLPAGEQ